MTVFLAIVKDGHIHLSEGNALRFADFAKKNEGKILRITHEKTKRSLQQNAFYWLYLKVIATETGDDENSLHEYFKRALLPPKWLKVMGKEIKVPASTTTLSKSDMSDYMAKICALTHIPIPDPAEAGFYCEN